MATLSYASDFNSGMVVEVATEVDVAWEVLGAAVDEGAVDDGSVADVGVTVEMDGAEVAVTAVSVPSEQLTETTSSTADAAMEPEILIRER
ncbi:MAG TPA: hypothetical protein VK070_11730 [Acidimicrobiia bacterium]|nr:hypothetical protein [Acidimicrobiia bacterium]